LPRDEWTSLVTPLSGNLTRCDARHRLKTGCCGDVVDGSVPPARTGEPSSMREFVFKASIDAVVRVHAADENAARKAVPTVLGAPGTVEIQLANKAQAAVGREATVTDVGFNVGSIKLATRRSDLSGTDAAAPVRTASVRRK
jgi:hypothetical protein